MNAHTDIQKNKGGAPAVVLSDEQIAEIPELAKHLNLEQIADYFAMAPRTIYQVMRRQPEVLAAYQKAKAENIVNASSQLRKAIDRGDLTAIIFFLKTQAGWSETRHIDITKTIVGSGGEDVDVRRTAKAIMSIFEEAAKLEQDKMQTIEHREDQDYESQS